MTPTDPPSERQQELTVLRRKMDHVQQDRILHLETRFDDLEARVSRELRGLDERIETKLRAAELLLVEKAAKLAVKQAFVHLGVDVDNPSDLQRFRDDLRFGGVFRVAAAKSFFALIAAVFGGLGLSLWMVFKDNLGLK